CGMLTHVDGLEVSIVISALSKSTFERYEETLVQPVYQLKKKGVKINVACVAYVGHHIDVPSFDYDKPLSEWEEKIRTGSVFVSASY
ncbi:hypothetical protein CC86DRAFT_265438, partial [Ophiobolus disseminans]